MHFLLVSVFEDLRQDLLEVAFDYLFALVTEELSEEAVQVENFPDTARLTRDRHDWTIGIHINSQLFFLPFVPLLRHIDLFQIDFLG